MTAIRTEADWTMQGRAQLGHEILDIAAPAGDTLGIDGYCYTGWYGRALGIPRARVADVLLPLLKRMTAAGLIERLRPEFSRSGYWRLAGDDRHAAHESWDIITSRRGWWSGRRT
jgi:hypothetical protein